MNANELNELSDIERTMIMVGYLTVGLCIARLLYDGIRAIVKCCVKRWKRSCAGEQNDYICIMCHKVQGRPLYVNDTYSGYRICEKCFKVMLSDSREMAKKGVSK